MFAGRRDDEIKTETLNRALFTESTTSLQIFFTSTLHWSTASRASIPPCIQHWVTMAKVGINSNLEMEPARPPMPDDEHQLLTEFKLYINIYFK